MKEKSVMSLSQLMLANLILVIDGVLAGMVMFSWLPASLAILSLPISLGVFAAFHRRLSFWQYLFIIHCVVAMLVLCMVIAVSIWGHEPFHFLLGA